MLKKIYHHIVRFIYYRRVRVLGYPTTRMQAVWWLYELKYLEPWRDVAEKIVELNKRIHLWLAAVAASDSRN